MGRQSLRITIVLGMLITLVGGTGIFAVFTDRATAGQDQAVTGSRPHAADLKIEMSTSIFGPTVDCDGAQDGNPPSQDHVTTAPFEIVSPTVGGTFSGRFVCLHNAGSAPVVITVSAIDLADIEAACSGDEEAWGDLTCGLDGGGLPQAGELAELLTVQVQQVECGDTAATIGDPAEGALSQLTAVPLVGAGASSLPLNPGSTACFSTALTYPFDVSEEDAQRAQSDQVSWRFAFDATAT